jgi:hypothetical protein
VYQILPIDRLTSDSLNQRPGTVTALIAIAILILLVAMNQLYAIWRSVSVNVLKSNKSFEYIQKM